jgi:CubicO group peptidase (beta-lactamase class C family)
MTAVIGPRRANRRATLIVALVLLTSTVTARADKVDDYVKAQMEAFHLPGLSLVVIKDGKIVKSAGYGLANVGKKVAATPETVYKIGIACSTRLAF